MEDFYDCSYCDKEATCFGKGQDADFYCDDHKHLAL